MYHIDPNDENAIVMDGFRNGISDDPYEGISDMRNLNIIPIPQEVSVNWATEIRSYTHAAGTITSADTGADTILISGTNLQLAQAFTIAGTSLPGGITAGTSYWALPTGGGNYQLYTQPSLNPSFLVNITTSGTPGNWTYTSIDMTLPKYFTFDGTNYWMVDSSGRVWSDYFAASGGIWTYTGNLPNNISNGNGIIAYQAWNSNPAATTNKYIFVMSNSSIDYATLSATTITWNYQWTPGVNYTAPGSYSASPSAVLHTPSSFNYNHEAIVGTDNRVYFTDANWVESFYQTSPTTAFDPEVASTYTFNESTILPFNDIGNCLAQLGTNLLIGGRKNVIYPWDRFSTTNSYPILISEFNIQKLVTVNTNTYIFSGNRGRIYITNGSQAQFYKKLPDHLSGTVEPYYIWGGATANKNQLYFSAKTINNSGTPLNTMGGVWGIDLDNKAIRLVNQMSYGTYAGYASALIPNFSSTASGTGLFIGWDSGTSTYGIDTTISTPYTGSQAYIDFDLIPIGTILKPKEPKTVEYKLSVPMVTNESVSIYYRLNFNNSYTLIFTSTNTTNLGGISESSQTNFDNAQWIQLRAVLNSTASSPSFTRLKEIRIR